MKSNEDFRQWSLREHWKRASQAKRAKWLIEALASLVALGMLTVYVLDHLQTERHFAVENRPHVIISRPPVLYGEFTCRVTPNAIQYQNGAIRLWVKNIGKGDAINAFVIRREVRLVPEKKTGNPSFDDVPVVTDQTCRLSDTSHEKDFPVYAGQEISLDITQSIGTDSLIKTNRVTIGQEPQPPPGVSTPERTVIEADASFQLYNSICVYYSGRDGASYGTCRTYRMNIGETVIPGSGRYVFSCLETPLKGFFDATFGKYCDN